MLSHSFHFSSAFLSHQAFATAIIFMTCTEKTQANFTCHWNNELSALLFCHYGIGWGSQKYSHLFTFCRIQRHKTTRGNIFLSKLLVLWESSPCRFFWVALLCDGDRQIVFHPHIHSVPLLSEQCLRRDAVYPRAVIRKM